jgi:hypothetical protein
VARIGVRETSGCVVAHDSFCQAEVARAGDRVGDTVIGGVGPSREPLPRRRSLSWRAGGSVRRRGARSGGRIGSRRDVRLRVRAPVWHLHRVNLIERQRDQRESEAVSCARAPRRPFLAPLRCRRSYVLTPGRRQRRARLHRHGTGSLRRRASPATGEKCAAIAATRPRPTAQEHRVERTSRNMSQVGASDLR